MIDTGMNLYRPCQFYIGKEVLPLGSYTRDKYKQCLKCKHFAFAMESYACHHSNGVACLTEKANEFEPAKKDADCPAG
jgi:hypothetical protein